MKKITKPYKCPYCDTAVAKEGNVCSNCYQKLIIVRKLIKIGELIKASEGVKK